MNDEAQPPVSRAELLAHVSAVSQLGALVPCQEIGDLMARLSAEDDNFTAAEVQQLFDYAVRQHSSWQVEWLFSAVEKPAAGASAERDRWALVCQAFGERLASLMPKAEANLRRAICTE